VGKATFAELGSAKVDEFDHRIRNRFRLRPDETETLYRFTKVGESFHFPEDGGQSDRHGLHGGDPETFLRAGHQVGIRSPQYGKHIIDDARAVQPFRYT
jgi:hypothetical protein